MSDFEPRRRFADWFGQWRVPLRKFLSGKIAVPPSDLDDVAQEVFLRLMRYDRAELIEHPQAYLFKMAANVAAEWAIRGRQVRARESKWMIGVPVAEGMQDQVGSAELQEEIARALLELSPRQREIVRLQFFEGLSRVQIADRLGMTERSVKRDLAKSYERLRARLRPKLLGGIVGVRD